MTFVDFLAEKLGTHRWCVAHHLGSRMRERYDLAITQKRYRELELEYAQTDPDAAAHFRKFLIVPPGGLSPPAT
jgi:hypothetical protein